jgi:CRISPR-associated endonuclease Cas3-HD
VISDGILSYYCEPISPRGAAAKEYLSDHIKSALSFLEGADFSRAYRLAERFTASVEFGELLRTAVVLHDAGKAFFQDEGDLRENRDRNMRYLSFAGHEYISAAITDAIMFKLSEYSGKPLYDQVTFAVLHHHHAMTRRRELILHKLGRKMRQMPSSEYQESLSKLKEVLRQFLPDLRDAIESGLPSSACVLTESICPTYHKIYEVFVHRREPAQKKLAFLLLNCLIACDYLAAKSRGGRSAHFQHAVEEFVNAWLRISNIGHFKCST